jgi:5-methylcytosine-specific restriction endonuclease McrA
MPVIDKTKWSDEELMVFEEYRYLCVLCGFQLADTLHHEPPRSLNPNWKDEPWTQFPLCNAHHELVTNMGRSEAQEMILHHVDTYAPGAIERIKSRVTSTS